MNPQILYLFDPLCGWCYGFSDTIFRFSERHKTEFEFVAIPGGMVTGERIAPFASMYKYISGAYQKVENMTGVKFGENYLKSLLPSENILMDSEPPSRAIITFRTFDSDQSIAFAKALQKAHYQDGKDYNDTSWYAPLAIEFGIDPADFQNRFEEKKMFQHVQEEFAWVKESGVQGYPTVVLRNGSKYYLLTNGCTTIENLESSLQKATQMIVK
jgi:putative protein-disulfide isomerase